MIDEMVMIGAYRAIRSMGITDITEMAKEYRKVDTTDSLEQVINGLRYAKCVVDEEDEEEEDDDEEDEEDDDDDDFTIGICLNTDVNGLGGYEEYNISSNCIDNAIEESISEYADELINKIDDDDIPDEVELEIFAENDDDQEEIKAVATLYFSNGSYTYNWRWE